jgi:hypothetical protein
MNARGLKTLGVSPQNTGRGSRIIDGSRRPNLAAADHLFTTLHTVDTLRTNAPFSRTRPFIFQA